MTTPQEDQDRNNGSQPPAGPSQQERDEALLKQLAERLMASPTFQQGMANNVKQALDGMKLGTIITQSVNDAIDQRVATAQQRASQTGNPATGQPESKGGGINDLAVLLRSLGLGGGSPTDMSQMESMGKTFGSLVSNLIAPIQSLYDAGRRDYASQLTIMARSGLPITVEGLEAAARPPQPVAGEVAHQRQGVDFGKAIQSIANNIRISP